MEAQRIKTCPAEIPINVRGEWIMAPLSARFARVGTFASGRLVGLSAESTCDR
jgi:hypothetical protein